MGNRALIARERDDGRYDLYYSQWGGADPTLARRLGADPGDHPAVDARPFETGVAWADLLADHCYPVVHEALFVLPADGPGRAYRPLWLGPLDDDGVLVPVDAGVPRDDARVLGWFDGARDALAVLVDGGDVEEATATAALREALADRYGDREVVALER